MKILRQDLDDLRPEYSRSDFGEMVQGKYAATQFDFAELLRLLISCVGEDEGLTFTHHSPANRLAVHCPGDWTYELDNANQITLRYWLSEFGNLEEPMSNPHSATTAQESADLLNLILKHVRILKTRVDAL